MISARLFLAGMYLHLALSVGVPAAILAAGEWNDFTVALFFGYLAVLALVHIAGWVCVAMAARALSKGETDRLRRGWRLLKLGSIPFFLLNFGYSVLVWGLLVGASRGIAVFLLTIPIAVTCLLILQTGCVGCCCVRQLRRQSPPVPGRRHYLFQLLPVADVADTLWLLWRYRLDAAGRSGMLPPARPARPSALHCTESK